LETLLAVEAEVPGRGGAAEGVEGVERLRRCVFTAAVVFLGTVEETDVGGEVVSACIDTGRREGPVDVVDVAVPLLLATAGKLLAVADVAGFLSAVAEVAAGAVPVLVLAVLLLKLRFGGSSFFSLPVAVVDAVAVVEILLLRVELLKLIDLPGSTFFVPRFSFSSFSFSLSFSSSLLLLSFKFLAPAVRRITVRSFGSFLSGAGGGGMRALSVDPVSDVGVTSRLILDLGSCEGEGNRESVAPVELSVADEVVLDGVGIALLGICLDEGVADEGVEGAEGTGSGMADGGCGRGRWW
jgi:hypothetical protein